MTGAEIIHAYGATETTPLVTINRLKPWMENELDEEAKWDMKRRQGYPVVGLDLKIVDAFGNKVPQDGKSAGEILIRGPWITAGYYNAPGSEAQFTADGYWKSGDAGTIDSEGYVKITDRVKDLIKSGGEWISSVDMENEIMAHPKVMEASVTGVAHPKWEERPVAVVVPRPEFKDTLDARGDSRPSGAEIRQMAVARGGPFRFRNSQDQRGQIQQEGDPRDIQGHLSKGRLGPVRHLHPAMRRTFPVPP